MSEQAKMSQSSAPDIRLLRTKLYVPRAHPALIERRLLANRLNAGLVCKLTLVSAPAGSGKTTLLSSWIARSQIRAAWVSLDERDNDPARFWAYMIAALQMLEPDLGKMALAMLQSPQPPPIEAILTELVNETALIQADFVLVLDDYHVIQNEAIHSALVFWLENLPAPMHLVISSRVEPPLPLPSMRVRRDLVELSATDLRFSDEEAAVFLNQVMGLNLAAQDISALEKLTEGWVAGLQLAALSMQGEQDIPAFIHSFTGSHRYVFDYLAQEVLHRQPKPIRHFLLSTSILERLNGGLCDALIVNREKGIESSSDSRFSTLHSQSMLEYLEHSNLFLVPLDQQRQWYRYHHLFADFLRARLNQEAGQAEVAELHRRASAWNIQHGYTAEAIHHALAAGDLDQAMAVIDQAASAMFERSELTTLIQWLAALPEGCLQTHPRLSIIYAWALIATGRSDAVEPHLQDIERHLGAAADGSEASLAQPVEIRGALAEISNLRASLAFNRMDVARVVALSRQTHAYLGEDVLAGLFNKQIDLRAVASFNLGVANEFAGQLQEASKALSETIRLSQQAGNYHLIPLAESHLAQLHILMGQPRRAAQIYRQSLLDFTKHSRPSPFAGLAYTGLGNLLYEWNELEQAKEHFDQGIELGRKWTQWEILISGYAGLARVSLAQENPQQAFDYLQELDDLARRFQVSWAAPLVASIRALVWARQGALEEAGEWARASSISTSEAPPYPREAEALILAQVLIAQERLDEAAQLIANLLDAAETGQRWGRLIEILALMARTQYALGRIETAQASLGRALSLAEPEGYLRTFIDLGQPLAELLHTISGQRANEARAAISKDYLERLLAAFDKSKKDERPGEQARTTKDEIKQTSLAFVHPSSTLEPLSERELEVLRLIALGLTNQEIADRLVISLNTVKTHVKNIHSRLEVRNRTEATARAREMGLI